MDTQDEKPTPILDDTTTGPQDENKPGSQAIPPRLRRLYDPNVPFQEYQYYARQTREEQKNTPPPAAGKNILAYLIPTLQKAQKQTVKLAEVNTSDDALRANITDEEWVNASRAMRLTSAGAVFYLITTDIFGPFGLPYAFATLGWGPGVVLYTVFALMAGFSGYLLWDCFMSLDSHQFPVKNFGDFGLRIYGTWCRYLINILQAIQMLCLVGAIIISNGEALSQASKFSLCYAICCLVWALAGFFFGQIRTLQQFTWLANVAVFLNLMVMFVTMGGAAHSPPLYSAWRTSAGYTINPELVRPSHHPLNFPPVQQSAGIPGHGNLSGTLTGAMQAVYAFGGTMIFPEFMAEMRRPRDFLKGMWGAQLFIYLCYMLYGLYMYGFQGQYVQTPAYLGISDQQIATAGDSIAMVSALIAATLYGNIGIKIFYNNILVEFFKAPPLHIKSGKLLWLFVVPVYWCVAYVIGASIPDFAGFTGIVAAVCILNFTYTFPPLLHLGMAIQRNAARSEGGFNGETGEIDAQDRGVKRWVRGFFAHRWYINVFNVLYMLGALALCGLGVWGSVENLIKVYSVPQLNAFVCVSPLEG